MGVTKWADVATAARARREADRLHEDVRATCATASSAIEEFAQELEEVAARFRARPWWQRAGLRISSWPRRLVDVVRNSWTLR